MEGFSLKQKVGQFVQQNNKKKVIEMIQKRRQQYREKFKCKIQQVHQDILRSNDFDSKMQLLQDVIEQLINGNKKFDYDEYQLLWIINHLTQVENCHLLFSKYNRQVLDQFFEFLFVKVFESSKVDTMCSYILSNCLVEQNSQSGIQQYYQQQFQLDRRCLEGLQSDSILTTTKINLSYLLMFFPCLKNDDFAIELIKVINKEILQTKSQNYLQNLIILAYAYIYSSDDDQTLMGLCENLVQKCKQMIQDIHQSQQHDFIYATIYIIDLKYNYLEGEEQIQNYLQDINLKQFFMLLSNKNSRVRFIVLLFLNNIIVDQEVLTQTSAWYINFGLLYETIQEIIFSEQGVIQIESLRLFFGLIYKTDQEIFDQYYEDKSEEIFQTICFCLKNELQTNEEQVIIALNLLLTLLQTSTTYVQQLKQNEQIKSILEVYYECNNNEISNLVSEIVEKYYNQQLNFFLYKTL